MRRIVIGTLTVASLALATGAMAQGYSTPVPNASGSQVTNPETYRDTAKRDRERSMMLQQKKMGMTTGSITHHPMKKKHTTKKHTTHKPSTMHESPQY